MGVLILGVNTLYTLLSLGDTHDVERVNITSAIILLIKFDNMCTEQQYKRGIYKFSIFVDE